MQQPKLVTIKDRKLVGLSIQTTLAENKTFELWHSFKTLAKNIKNRANTDAYSLQVYENNFDMRNFTPTIVFEKWAAFEVTNFEFIPEKLNTFVLSGGLYAVFIHKGTTQEFYKTASYIYGVWLPKSKYTLDNRPHFEILKENYNPSDPNNEEEVWIPIK